ncbi:MULTISPECIES: hypothetical protein [unclassified Clostridium]|uniref:hypothetical protein n=1 Tax=unclassified Clostridium TaxID=2614128 RepID=UPI00321695AE
MNEIKEVIKALEKVKVIIVNYEMDLSYSTCESEKQLISDLDVYIAKLKSNDLSCKKEISLLFAPTGDLQEIAIDSGWSDEYIKLAQIIDRCIK